MRSNYYDRLITKTHRSMKSFFNSRWTIKQNIIKIIVIFIFLLIPVFTGFGEGVDDMAVFDAESFVDKILM